MPPILLWFVGAAGALTAARWIVKESRRINAELHPERYGEAAGAAAAPASSVRLRRDASGVYRPE
jgi:hypothetical protein